MNSNFKFFKKMVDLKIKLVQKDEIYLHVKARPNAQKTQIKGIMEDGTIKIEVTAKPEKDKANQEIIKFLSKKFEVLKDNVIIISGKKDRIKLIKINKL